MAPETRLRLEQALRKQAALLALTRSPTLHGTDLEPAFREITRTSAETLEVERVSLWTFTEDRSAIRCVCLFERSTGSYSSGQILHRSTNASYFRALEESDVIAAEFAETDPRTAGFLEGYLRPHAIRSMMDSPILESGHLWGVVCHESVGEIRPWTQDERMFAVAVANLVARMLTDAALRDSGMRLQEFLESANDMVVFLSPQGCYEYVNRAWREAIGYTSEEARSLTWKTIVAPDQLSALLPLWNRILAGENVGRIEVVKLTKDGRRIHTEGSLRCTTVEGRPVSVRGIFQNMTEQRKVEEALRQSEERVTQLEEQAGTRTSVERLVGKSAPMQEVYRRLRLAAQSDVTVLLTGESGTGKELAAAAVHSLSARRDKPFVAVNCSAIPDSLLESELFGHVKGAFTGAIRDKVGLFQAAQGGTLFLDEVGDMTPALQVKVLRALQEREIRRVGDERVVKVDVRVITATNRDLKALLEKEQLRQDFYYRIAVYPIVLPPLRERREDILLLVDHFIVELSKACGKPAPKVKGDALRTLMEYSWPGNVRELKNALEHALVTLSGEGMTADDLPPEIRSPGKGTGPAPQEIERRRILESLEQSGGNRAKAAKLLGISRVTLWKRMQKLGIVKPER